jgi:hypothetical protein
MATLIAQKYPRLKELVAAVDEAGTAERLPVWAETAIADTPPFDLWSQRNAEQQVSRLVVSARKPVTRVVDALGLEHNERGEFTSKGVAYGRDESHQLVKEIGTAHDEIRHSQVSKAWINAEKRVMKALPNAAVELHPTGSLTSDPDRRAWNARCASGIALACERFAKMYPESAAKVGYVVMAYPKGSVSSKYPDPIHEMGNGREAYAECDLEDRGIKLSTGWWDRGDTNFKDSLKTGDDGFHAYGCGTPEGVMSHELGHVLNAIYGDRISSIYDIPGQGPHAREYAGPDTSWGWYSQPWEGRRALASQYASTDRYEAFAEAYAEVTVDESRATPKLNYDLGKMDVATVRDLMHQLSTEEGGTPLRGAP